MITEKLDFVKMFIFQIFSAPYVKVAQFLNKQSPKPLKIRVGGFKNQLFIESEILFLTGSAESTLTLTMSPTETASEG